MTPLIMPMTLLLSTAAAAAAAATTTTTTDKEYFRSPIIAEPIALTKSTEDKEGG